MALPVSFTDPACRQVARTRADDAAVNGYEPDIQARIASDAYSNCVRLK